MNSDTLSKPYAKYLEEFYRLIKSDFVVDPRLKKKLKQRLDDQRLSSFEKSFSEKNDPWVFTNVEREEQTKILSALK